MRPVGPAPEMMTGSMLCLLLSLLLAAWVLPGVGELLLPLWQLSRPAVCVVVMHLPHAGRRVWLGKQAHGLLLVPSKAERALVHAVEAGCSCLHCMMTAHDWAPMTPSIREGHDKKLVLGVGFYLVLNKIKL